MNKLTHKERTNWEISWSFTWHHLLKFHTSEMNKISVICFLNCLLTLQVSHWKKKKRNCRFQYDMTRRAFKDEQWCWHMPNLLSPARMAASRKAELSIPPPSSPLLTAPDSGWYFSHQISPLAFCYPRWMSMVNYPGKSFFKDKTFFFL